MREIRHRSSVMVCQFFSISVRVQLSSLKKLLQIHLVRLLWDLSDRHLSLDHKRCSHRLLFIERGAHYVNLNKEAWGRCENTECKIRLFLCMAYLEKRS